MTSENIEIIWTFCDFIIFYNNTYQFKQLSKMGCTSPTNVEQVQMFQHPNIQRFIQIMRLDHPLNINKKYEHLCKIYQNEFVNNGYKRTNAYDCLTTEIELNLKRKQFWQTRTSGRKQCWIGLQIAVQSQSSEQAFLVLQQVGLTLLQNSIQMAIDTRGNKYDVPIFCINLPKKFSKTTLAQTHLNQKFQAKQLEVKIRSTRFVTDSTFHLKNDTTVASLKDIYKTNNKLSDECKLRFFYNGREILDHHSLGNYSFRQGEVIQAMIIGS